MKDIHNMTVTELIKLGYKIVVTEPPHDKEFGYFLYDGKPIGKTPRFVTWLKSEIKGEQK